MRFISLAFILAGMSISQAHAQVKGEFIGSGTYASAEGCLKLAAIEAGGEKNVETVPDTLTENGFSSWEGACTFASVTEKEKGKSWLAHMVCAEEAEEGEETDLFERIDDRHLRVTVMGNASVLERCDADKEK